MVDEKLYQDIGEIKAGISSIKELIQREHGENRQEHKDIRTQIDTLENDVVRKSTARWFAGIFIGLFSLVTGVAAKILKVFGG